MTYRVWPRFNHNKDNGTIIDCVKLILWPIFSFSIQNTLFCKFQVSIIFPKNSIKASHYDILNVSKSASQEEVKSSFLHLSKIHHPDAGGSTEQFQLLQDAFEHLKKDFKKRKIEKDEYEEYTPMVFTKEWFQINSF